MNWLKIILRKKRQFMLWFISYMVVVAVSVLVNLVGYSYAIRTTQQEVGNVNRGAMTQMQIVYDSYFQAIESNSYQMLNSPAVQTLASLQVTHQREVELFQDLIAAVRLSNGAKEWIETTEVIFRDKDICIDEGAKYTPELLYEIRYDDFYSSKDAWLNDLFITGLTDYKIITDQNGNTRFLYLYMSPTAGLSPVVVVTEVSQKVFAQYLSKISEANGGNALIVDPTGEIMFSASPIEEPLDLQLEGQYGMKVKAYHGQKYVVNYEKSTVLDGAYYVQMTENSVYISKINATRNFFLITFLLCICIGAAMAYFFAKINYRPVKRLLHTLADSEAEPGDGGEFEYIENRLAAMMHDHSLIEKKMNSQRNTLRETFLARMLLGKVEIADKNNKYLMEYGIELDGSLFAVVLFNIMELGLVEDESGEADWESYKMAHFVISNVFAELMSGMAKVYFCEVEDMYAAVVNFMSDAGTNTLIAEKVEYANQFLREHLQMEFVCGISSLSNEAIKLPVLYQQAYEMITYRFLTEDTHTFIYDKMMNATEVYQYTPEMEEQLKTYIASGQGTQAANYVHHIIETNLLDKKMSLDMVRILVAELTSTILKMTVEMKLPEDMDIRSVCRLSSELTDLSKMEGVIEELKCFTVQLSKLYEENTRKTVDSRCENIKNYIEAHYADPNLNVSSIANAFGLSVSYLSFYFKDQMSEGLAEYIVKYRVEKAKELLRNTDETVAAIAEKVGFCSSNVFIRAFKKVTSVTPGHYKNENRI